MKNKILLIGMIISGILLSTCTKDNKVQLFNGKDLSNWEKVVFEEADVDEVFQVEDGVIKVSGAPFGYILTQDSYSDYKLHVEWRWPTVPSNSGVLLHVQETNTVEWPLCIESQLKSGDAGDIVLIGHGAGVSVGDSTYLLSPEMRRYKSIPKFEESNESTAGQWNTYDITCSGANIEIVVNGVLQNNASQSTLSSGPIALQSEGTPIEFRNVYLIPLK